MQLHAVSLSHIESHLLPGRSAVICMADSAEQFAIIKDTANIVARLDLIFNDTGQKFGLVRPPQNEDARRILKFVQTHRHLPHFVAQCQVGVGRSQAVLAALTKMRGVSNKKILERGTYNRTLYKALLSEAGIPVPPEPLVSIAIRVKYAPDRLRLFILSMQRQRHENWELIAVTDGPNAAAVRLIEEIDDARVRLITTKKRLGRWGHPYRQIGLDACRGEFIGMSNDDNYYVPGYIEQMINAIQNYETGADIAMCQIIHNYSGWGIARAGTDLGCWIARASLVRQVPWPGNDFDSDTTYIQSLRAIAADRAVIVRRPLFVHN